MEKLAGVILAAGLSSRMGVFKPLLEIEGVSMVRRVVQLMRGAGAHPVAVVTGHRRRELEEHLQGASVELIHNPDYASTQQFDSLWLALARLPNGAEKVVVCPGDVPLVKCDTIRALLRADGDFVRPCCQGVSGHPVALSGRVLPELMAFDGSGGLREAAKAAGITFTDIEVQDPGTTLDKGTRNEYEALLKYRRQATGTPQPLQLEVNLSLRAETSFWGQDCARFLELIQVTGSMLCACQCIHMSYSKGWKMMNEIERQLGYPVLTRNKGGSCGGGSFLTKEGQHFLSQFQNMQEELWRAAQVSFHRYFGNKTV